MNKLDGVAEFLEVIRRIRDPQTGCPWDLAQTHESLLKYFIEEVHEFVEAMRDRGPDSPETWEELGDVMLQVGLHTSLAAEKGITDFNEVCRQAAAKLVLRHPHVFDPDFPRFKTPDEVNRAWEQIKAWAREKQAVQKPQTAPVTQLSSQPRADQVDKVPSGLSALLRALRIGEKAAAFRFDWPDAATVLDKVLEETEELVAASDESEARAQEEYGDLLFALAQLARKRKWDPEQVLEAANRKFCRRFRLMEDRIRQDGRDWDTLDLEQLEAVWQTIKKPARDEPLN